MTKLSNDEITTALASLPGWSRAGDTLTKTYTFATFPNSISFVDRVAVAAEEMGHHPDMTITYTRVAMTLATHDEGGVTQKDVTLAQRIDTLA